MKTDMMYDYLWHSSSTLTRYSPNLSARWHENVELIATYSGKRLCKIPG